MTMRRQFSIAALLGLILCSAITLALARVPDIRLGLMGLAVSGLFFVGSWFVIYFCFACIHLILWLFHDLRSRKWWPEQASRTAASPRP